MRKQRPGAAALLEKCLISKLREARTIPRRRIDPGRRDMSNSFLGTGESHQLFTFRCSFLKQLDDGLVTCSLRDFESGQG
jgi:hypothetical protein